MIADITPHYATLIFRHIIELMMPFSAFAIFAITPDADTFQADIIAI
jgi:hypothetical protein